MTLSKNRNLYWILLIIIALCGCGEDSGDSDGTSLLTPTYLLPDDNEISGWEGIDAHQEANDLDSLYELINGGAEIFIDNGFISAAFQTYNSCIGGVCSTAPVQLRIYDQGDSANSLAVYNRVGSGIGIPWDGAGTEARIDESALAAYTIEFWKSNFFVQVVIEDKTDEALNIAKLFASQISDAIG